MKRAAPGIGRRDLAVIFGLALAANGLAARFVSQPGYTDAYYYFGGARQLADGHGFTEPYLWNYLARASAVAPPGPPWPSHLYWMPLASIVAAPFLVVARQLAGAGLSAAGLFRAAQWPFILLAAGLPLLSYLAALAMGGGRRHAVAAAVLTVFSPFYFAYWTTTDGFALYALATAGALLLAVQADGHRARAGRWLFAAGLAAGLAHLTRADGALVLVCLLAWAIFWRRGATGRRGRWSGAAALLLGYACVMVPWFWRNWLTVGAPLAPGATRALWLTRYDDIFTFWPERLTPAAYLATGLGGVLHGKWAALVANTETLVAVQCGIVAFPFALAGLWRWRTTTLVQLAAVYGALLFVAMTLAFSFPGARGGYFHSGAALLPIFMPAAVLGLDGAVEAVARRLRHWQPERSKPMFTGLLVLCAMLLTVIVFWKRVLGPGLNQATWAESERTYAEAGAWLQAHGQAGALAAVTDPPGWYYWTGQPAIVIPNGDAAVLQEAMTTYATHWVVLDANRPAALSELYSAPEASGTFVMRARFADQAGQPVYLLELEPGP